MTHSLTQIIHSKKAILWDFDGCVCDSEEIHYEAYAQAFRHFNHEVNKNEYFHTFTHTGGGIAQEVQNHNLTLPQNEIKKLKSEYYYNFLIKGRAKLFSEVPKIVAKLRKLKIKNIIVSNSPVHEIELILKQSKALGLFDSIIGLEEGLRKKPFPDLFLKALKKNSLKTQDVLILEDSERGLIAAREADCQAIWIINKQNKNLKTNAEYLARLTHKEFLSYVDGQFYS